MNDRGAAGESQDEEVGVAASDGTIVAPESMSAGDINQARQQVADLVRSVQQASGSRQLAVLDEVSTVGLKSQRNAGRQLELVKIRLASLAESGSGNAVSNDLLDLRLALDRINPAAVQRGPWSRLLAAVPFGGSSMVRALKKIAMRYEPVSQQVTVIETRLREGRTMLARDNVELRTLYEDVETQQDAILRQAFIGELLLHELTVMLDAVTDPSERDRIQHAAHDVATRLQDLHTMLEVNLQYFVSIELSRQNNSQLAQAVDRTLALATNVVTIGLAIQAALMRQRAVKEATERTRAFLGEMVSQNAATIRRQTEEIGDLYNRPVIAMDKLQQAHADLLAALDAARRVHAEGLGAARQNIVELTELTKEMSSHVLGLDADEGGPR